MHEVISSNTWALETRFFDRVSRIVLYHIANGKELGSLKSLFAVKNKETERQNGVHLSQTPVYLADNITMNFDKRLGMSVYETGDNNRIAKIPMCGTLVKDGGWYTYGSRDLAAMVQRAGMDSSIDAILPFIDGPGGSVSGIRELGLAFANATAIKPVISFVDEMAASAHYWAASQSDYIMGNINEYAQVGSIGVLSVMINEGEFLKKQGLEVTIMRAGQSTDKAKLNSVEPYDEDALKAHQANLDNIAEDFINTVMRGRGDRLVLDEENVFSGKMYNLEEAADLGLVDSQGTLTDAVAFASDVAKSRKKSTVNFWS